MTTRIKLDELLRRSGKTAHDVHEATGIMEATLSDWRNNKVTKLDRRTIVLLCRFFNCTVDDLIEYIPD
jgi:putative transcriptional regulator